MNIKEELVELIFGVDEYAEMRTGLIDDIADAIVERFAVIELPEPTTSDDRRPKWDYDSGEARVRRVVLIEHSQEIPIVVSSGQFHSVETARALAAALLAAAKRVEAQS